jgi:hypothetical protein
VVEAMPGLGLPRLNGLIIKFDPCDSLNSKSLCRTDNAADVFGENEDLERMITTTTITCANERP